MVEENESLPYLFSAALETVSTIARLHCALGHYDNFQESMVGVHHVNDHNGHLSAAYLEGYFLET